MAEFLLTQSLSLSHGSRLYSEANRLAFCFAHLHIHGAPGSKDWSPGAARGQGVPRATALLRDASQRPGVQAETPGGKAGCLGRNSESALGPVASFHPLPSRKDAPEEDFKVFPSKGESHLESFSQKERQIIRLEREANLRAKRGRIKGSVRVNWRREPFQGGRTFSDFGQDILEPARQWGSKSRSESAFQKVTWSLPFSLSLSHRLKKTCRLCTLGKSVGGGGRKWEQGALRKQRESPPPPCTPCFPLPGAPQTPSDSALCSLFLGPGRSAPRAADGQGNLGCSLCSVLICIFNYSSKICIHSCKIIHSSKISKQTTNKKKHTHLSVGVGIICGAFSSFSFLVSTLPSAVLNLLFSFQILWILSMNLRRRRN